MAKASGVCAVFFATACHAEPAHPAASRADAAVIVAPPLAASEAIRHDAQPQPPITGFFEALPVPGYPDAWLSLPTGASERRPVVIVIHGSGDRPDWQCGGWRNATDGYPFVLCPRGAYSASSSTKDDARYTHAGGASLLGHIDAALAALVVRYPAYADTNAPLLAGFSLGAWEVLALAVQEPSRFPRLALIEGGAGGWTEERVAAFRGRGGQRILFGCGQRACEVGASATAKRLSRRGLDARVVFASVNHTFDPPLENAVRAELSWLIEGDTRWEGLTPLR